MFFNNLNANSEEKKIDNTKTDSILQTIKNQEGEIKVLKKLLWEKGKIIVLCWRCRKNKRWDLGKNTRNSGGKEQDKKEMISLELQKLIEIMFKQYFQKTQTNEEFLKELL